MRKKNKAPAERFKIAPFMKDYERLKEVWLPYLMYFHTPGFRSGAVNTDRDGFRLQGELRDSTLADLPKDQPVSLLVGNSTAFGVGCSDDSHTMSAQLASLTGRTWLNFAGRSFTSTQELLLFFYHYHRLPAIRHVILFSGLAAPSLFYRAWEYARKYGIFFSWNRFNKLFNNREDISRAHPFLNRILSRRTSHPQDLSGVSRKQLLKLALGKSFSQTQQDLTKTLFHRVKNPKAEKGVLLEVVEHDLRNWKLLSESLGFSLTYVLQPLIQWTRKSYSQEESLLIEEMDNFAELFWRVFRDYMDDEEYAWLVDTHSALCRQFNIPFWDMSALMSKEDIDHKWMFVDRFHLSDRGNQLAAQLIYRKILQPGEQSK